MQIGDADGPSSVSGSATGSANRGQIDVQNTLGAVEMGCDQIEQISTD